MLGLYVPQHVLKCPMAPLTNSSRNALMNPFQFLLMLMALMIEMVFCRF